ncbi:MAG: succinyl-CoA--3-ketoacid-CoA transferase [Legionellales bacterium]|nr:succinyl-CoA--3-ketoacid-CoA transferase [Legionellales bacterium]
MKLSREQIAKRIAQEIKTGYYVNLGIGIPTLVANYISDDVEIMLQSENGLLGMGAYPTNAQVDPDLINAGKETVTAARGASFFSSAESFAMIRGGHVDLTVLGAFEVDQQGSIASWMIPEKMVKGMGGAMDLVAGAKNIVVAMNHTSKSGESKLLNKCTLPLTGLKCIHKVVTDMAVLEIKSDAFHLIEVAPGISTNDIKDATQGKLIISDNVKQMEL